MSLYDKFLLYAILEHALNQIIRNIKNIGNIDYTQGPINHPAAIFNKGSNLDIPRQQPFPITLSLDRRSLLKKTAQIIIRRQASEFRIFNQSVDEAGTAGSCLGAGK